MTIHADKNLYPGINAHLNSLLQNEPGGWANFHAEHIIHLREFIDDALPDGYYARSEKSLQIGEYDPGAGTERVTGTKPDITLFRAGPPPGSGQVAMIETFAPSLTVPLPETLEEEDELTGLVIYQAGEGGALGRPITRVELLSPANKRGGSHHEQYMVKRWETLKSGLRLVEIDYLHQSPPVIHNIPDYSAGVKDAIPYTILVSDPRPTFEQGSTHVYAFGVDDPLPVINVPLAGADVVKVNFGAVYQRSFESSRFFRMVVDYAQQPVQFERYHPADRDAIQKRLMEIRTRAGETTP